MDFSQSQISFSIYYQSNSDVKVKISGDIEQLGSWDLEKALNLQPDPNNPSFWRSLKPIIVKKDIKFHFKCLLLTPSNQIIRWERLPNDQNRRYKAKNSKVILKGSLDDAEGKELIENEEEEGSTKAVERKKEEDIKVMKNSINIDENTRVHKKHMEGSFDPFSFAERSDSEEEMDEALIDSKLSFPSQDEMDKLKNFEEMRSINEADSAHHHKQRNATITINEKNQPKQHLPKPSQKSSPTQKESYQTLFEKIVKRPPPSPYPSSLPPPPSFFPPPPSFFNPSSSLTPLSLHSKKEHFIIVSEFLPLKLSSSGEEVFFDSDLNFFNVANLLHIKFSQKCSSPSSSIHSPPSLLLPSSSFTFVGLLKTSSIPPPSLRPSLLKQARQKFNCQIVFPDDPSPLIQPSSFPPNFPPFSSPFPSCSFPPTSLLQPSYFPSSPSSPPPPSSSPLDLLLGRRSCYLLGEEKWEERKRVGKKIAEEVESNYLPSCANYVILFLRELLVTGYFLKKEVGVKVKDVRIAICPDIKFEGLALSPLAPEIKIALFSADLLIFYDYDYYRNFCDFYGVQTICEGKTTYIIPPTLLLPPSPPSSLPPPSTLNPPPLPSSLPPPRSITPLPSSPPPPSSFPPPPSLLSPPPAFLLPPSFRPSRIEFMIKAPLADFERLEDLEEEDSFLAYKSIFSNKFGKKKIVLSFFEICRDYQVILKTLRNFYDYLKKNQNQHKLTLVIVLMKNRWEGVRRKMEEREGKEEGRQEEKGGKEEGRREGGRREEGREKGKRRTRQERWSEERRRLLKILEQEEEEMMEEKEEKEEAIGKEEEEEEEKEEKEEEEGKRKKEEDEEKEELDPYLVRKLDDITNVISFLSTEYGFNPIHMITHSMAETELLALLSSSSLLLHPSYSLLPPSLLSSFFFSSSSPSLLLSTSSSFLPFSRIAATLEPNKQNDFSEKMNFVLNNHFFYLEEVQLEDLESLKKRDIAYFVDEVKQKIRGRREREGREEAGRKGGERMEEGGKREVEGRRDEGERREGGRKEGNGRREEGGEKKEGGGKREGGWRRSEEEDRREENEDDVESLRGLPILMKQMSLPLPELKPLLPSRHAKIEDIKSAFNASQCRAVILDYDALLYLDKLNPFLEAINFLSSSSSLLLLTSSSPSLSPPFLLTSSLLQPSSYPSPSLLPHSTFSPSFQHYSVLSSSLLPSPSILPSSSLPPPSLIPSSFLQSLTIISENGLWLKESGSKKFSKLFTMDWSWKEVVRPILTLYKRRTPGSREEEGGGRMGWVGETTEDDFCAMQKDELINHLKGSLEYFEEVEGSSAELFLKKLACKPTFLLVISHLETSDGLFEYVERYWMEEGEGAYFEMKSDEGREDVFRLLKELGK